MRIFAKMVSPDALGFDAVCALWTSLEKSLSDKGARRIDTNLLLIDAIAIP